MATEVLDLGSPSALRPQPEGYRQLTDGFNAIDVAAWAQQRVCLYSGERRSAGSGGAGRFGAQIEVRQIWNADLPTASQLHLPPTPHAGSSSLYARHGFRAGEVLSSFGAKATLSTPNYLTVQVGEQRHIMLQPDWLQVGTMHASGGATAWHGGHGSFRGGEALRARGSTSVAPPPEPQHDLTLHTCARAQYINHSCDPNVAFDTTTLQLVALKDIQVCACG